MEEFNDKSDTIKFTPPDEKKEYVKRTQDSIYSAARKNNEDYYSEKETDTNKVLVYTAIILSILLVIVITVGIIVIKSDKSGKNSVSSLEENNEITHLETQEDEELLQENENEELKTTDCSLIFHSVMKKDDGYSVLADLYDEYMNEIDNRRLLINSETNIRESGERLSTEALIYAIENEAGDKIVFDATIREKDNVILSLSFELSPPEEVAGEEFEETEGEEEEILPEENEAENPQEPEESTAIIVQ